MATASSTRTLPNVFEIPVAVSTACVDIVDVMASSGILKVPGALVPGKEQSPDTLRGALYGTLLIATVVFMPQGVAGFLGDTWQRRPLRRWLRAKRMPRGRVVPVERSELPPTEDLR